MTIRLVISSSIKKYTLLFDYIQFEVVRHGLHQSKQQINSAILKVEFKFSFICLQIPFILYSTFTYFTDKSVQNTTQSICKHHHYTYCLPLQSKET